jgi:hypothetical protein
LAKHGVKYRKILQVCQGGTEKKYFFEKNGVFSAKMGNFMKSCYITHPMPRNSLLKFPDAELLKGCEVTAYKGSGPGGQHRNKTNSGVKLKLNHGSDIESYSCDDRSSHVNKLLALKKLRLKIALQMREEPTPQAPFAFPGTGGKISQSNNLYPQFIADVLDRIYHGKGDLGEAAKAWGLSKSALNKIILQDKKVLEVFQKIRSAASPMPSSEASSNDLPIHCKPMEKPSSLPHG